MSSHDRTGQSDEDWKRRQDLRAEENIRRFHIEFKDDQGERLELNKGLAEEIERLVNTLDGLSGKHEDPHPQVGMVHKNDPHHDAPMGTDQPQVTDFVVPALIMTAVVTQCLNKALETYQDQINALGERGTDGIKALGASIAETWDRFKADTEQAVEDAKQQITELVSAERTQDRAPAEPEKSTELGGKQVDTDTKEITELQDQQAKERARLEVQVKEAAKAMAERYEGKPEKDAVLQAQADAAKVAREAQAREHQAQLQRLQEQQLQAPTR